jgi:prevent-host-death family protein
MMSGLEDAHMSDRVWQASEARAKLPEVMENALAGKPQVIRKRGGEEVVMLSRADFERMKPSLKDYLLRSAGTAGKDGDASLAKAMAKVRATGSLGFAPRRPAK